MAEGIIDLFSMNVVSDEEISFVEEGEEKPHFLLSLWAIKVLSSLVNPASIDVRRRHIREEENEKEDRIRSP